MPDILGKLPLKIVGLWRKRGKSLILNFRLCGNKSFFFVRTKSNWMVIVSPRSHPFFNLNPNLQCDETSQTCYSYLPEHLLLKCCWDSFTLHKTDKSKTQLNGLHQYGWTGFTVNLSSLLSPAWCNTVWLISECSRDTSYFKWGVT